jgi:FAD/FMN-containing dehydrogenase
MSSTPAQAARTELSGFNGELIGPEDSAYEEARAVYNAMIDRRPALVARCADADAVARVIGFARAHDLPLAVRGGGHHGAGMGTVDGGVVADLSLLKDIQVDPEARTVRVGGGCVWGEVDRATNAHGLATPSGIVSTTGVGGIATGGGLGHLTRKCGLTIDNMLSAEVVLADGSVVTASEQENEDLFWGLRGGGGNFGIVTEFELRLHELGPTVYAGLALWPFERAAEVLPAWRDYAGEAPDEVASACVVITAPPAPFVPEHLRGRTAVGIAFLYVGDPDDGARAARPLKELRPDVDHIEPMPYTAFQAALDPFAPPGMRSYWRGEYLDGLPDGAIATFLEQAPAATEAGMPLSQMVLFRIGQAVDAVPDGATAFSQRHASYLFHPISVWQDPADDERLIAASRAFAEAMRPFGTGAAYLNFTPEADRVRSAYGEETYRRLVALKDAYDPDNLFRLNQNIAPSREAGEPALAR